MTIRVRVPASSANLGPGFDVLAAALGVWMELEVEENFTSQDLLAWLVNSLVETGAVPADSGSNASETGTTAVMVDGVAFETTAAIDFTSMKDYGVRGLSVETRGLEGDSFVRSISYDLAREAYSRSPEGYDAFFDAATP